MTVKVGDRIGDVGALGDCLPGTLVGSVPSEGLGAFRPAGSMVPFAVKCDGDDGDTWLGMDGCRYVEGEADGKVRVIGDVLVVEDFFVREVDWSSADLRSAHLQYANLEYAHLEYADLQYAKLRSANLESANLRVADLRFADLRGCIHSAGTVWPDGFDVDRLKF